VWSQPAGQVHDDKCEEGGDCIVAVSFHGKLDFIPVPAKAQLEGGPMMIKLLATWIPALLIAFLGY
jgi:hypothetical protein